MSGQEAVFEYSLENAREFASLVLCLFNRDTLEEAVREATSEKEELAMQGLPYDDRPNVLIPCNTHSLTPDEFDKFLKDPKQRELVIGEKTIGPGIYGRRNAAFLGTVQSGRTRPGFLVYDSVATVMVDLINRDGESILNSHIRADYLVSLERQLGYVVGWQPGSLCDDNRSAI